MPESGLATLAPQYFLDLPQQVFFLIGLAEVAFDADFKRALGIIGDEVKSQLLDPVLFNLFIEAKIYQLTAKE